MNLMNQHFILIKINYWSCVSTSNPSLGLIYFLMSTIGNYSLFPLIFRQTGKYSNFIDKFVTELKKAAMLFLSFFANALLAMKC